MGKSTSEKKISAKTVKGGTVYRNAKTGRFTSVKSGSVESHASRKSGHVIETISKRRAATLRRLADR